MTESAELPVLRADGSEVPVVIALSPVEGPGGKTLTAAVVRHAAERPLRDEQELLANVANFSNDAILTVDLCGWVTSWNVGAEGLYGWTAVEAIGRHISFIVPREHHEEAAATLARARSGEEVASHPTVRMRRGGDPIDVSVAESPIRDRSGRIAGVSSISRDITEEQAARESLVRYATELERSKRDLEEYATVTAHDLSEPLRVVGCSADLLRARHQEGRALDQAGLHHLEAITVGVERMRHLIERVLSLSQLRSDRRDHGPVDLTAVLDEVRTGLRPLIDESGADFFPAHLPVVWGDRSQLTLLMENLVSNALKFRHPARAARIVVGTTARDKEWAISVSDNGIGIDPAFHERIFGMFRRVHAPETFEGTGIGLALCRQIVNLHGGEIRVNSEAGQGSVFTFTLPASPPEGKGGAGHTGIPARVPPSGSAQPTSVSGAGRRFLPAGRLGREPAVSTNVLVEERSRAQRH